MDKQKGVSERYSNQFRSKTKKKGVPEDHNLACRIVKAWYRSYVPGCIVERDWGVYFSKEFVIENKLEYTYREYDLGFFEYVEGDKGKGESYAKLHTVVEVDGQRHQSKLVKINDGVAGKYIKEKYPWAKFVRLSKLDCNHPDKEEREAYFKKMFGV